VEKVVKQFCGTKMQMDARNQWNETKNVMRNFWQTALVSLVTLSEHLFAAANI